MNDQNISVEYLNSFVDNELDSDEKSELFEKLGHDGALKEQVCELRDLKEKVRHAYHQLPVRSGSFAKKQPSYFRRIQSLAACLLLLLAGGASGWVIAGGADSKSGTKMVRLLQTIQGSVVVSEPDKIIVQVSNSNPVRLKTALDETENLLETYKRSHRPLQVAIIANDSGVNLLRTDVSPYAARLRSMKAKYPNLTFLACNQTISKLRKAGVIVKLFPNTVIASSALEEINKRLLLGWDYVRV